MTDRKDQGHAALGLRSVTVDLPVRSVHTRSLRKAFLHRGTGGRLGGEPGRGLAVRALDDVSLSFRHGDRVGVVGRNGAGKTTLLRVLAGVYEPEVGDAWRLGRTAALLNVFVGFDDDASGRENIMTRGLLAGLGPEEIRARLGAVAEFSELGGYLEMPVNTYSTGMRFRLGFAVCTAFDPDILLMDEWLAVGDRPFLEKARGWLEAFAERVGILVLVSQDAALLRRVCTTAVVLDAGRVEAVGPVADVLEER